MDFSRNSYSSRMADYLRGQASQQQNHRRVEGQTFGSLNASPYEIRVGRNVYDSEVSSVTPYAVGSSAVDELVQFNSEGRLRVLASSVTGAGANRRSSEERLPHQPEPEREHCRTNDDQHEHHQSASLRYRPPPAAMPNKETRPFTTTNFSNHCVLLGRGKLALSHKGNIHFRRLIHERKERYRTAAKRYEKDMIAREVVNEIHSNGGKFLRKVEASEAGQTFSNSYRNPHGDGGPADYWVEVDDEQSLEKVKQALRDYLPASNCSKTARKMKKKKPPSDQDETSK